MLADSIARNAKGSTDGFNTLCILSNPHSDYINIYVAEKSNLSKIPQNLNDGTFSAHRHVSNFLSN